MPRRYSLTDMCFDDCADILTVEEASTVLRISRNYMYKFVKFGIISSIRVGRKIIIPKICLIEYIQSKIEKDGTGNLSGTFRKESKNDR